MIILVNDIDVGNKGCCDAGSGEFGSVLLGMVDESCAMDRLVTGVLGMTMDEFTCFGCA
jgi:hypothetical protein